MTIQRFAIHVFAVFALIAIGHSAPPATPAPAAAAPGASTGPSHDRLIIVGDSTACFYDKGRFAYRGWGMFIQPYLKDSIEVVNEARPGRSVRTYMLEGSWKNALREKPKFVLIQFGTNDAHDARTKEGVDPEISYPMFLNKYVNATLSASAIPILISPAHPRIFDGKGRMVDVLGPFNRAMHDVALKRGVAFVDLYTASGELYEKLGEDTSKQFEPMKNDHVHFNALGAKAMAELIMRRLVKVEPRIKEFLAPNPRLLGEGDQQAQSGGTDNGGGGLFDLRVDH